MAEPGTPLLGTKLVVPPLRLPLVPRPRLVERLHEVLNYNLVLTSASAGFGKTTLLSDWARQRDPRIPVAWLSLEEADNDPVRFWDYVVGALKTLQPAFGESTSAMLHSGQPLQAGTFPAESLLTVLINELAILSSPFVLVLDDYHLITAKSIHDGITYLVEHMPSQMHMVIATRADPPLPLAHFRGKGMMLEIRNDDLRFSKDEAAALFKAIKIPELSDEDAGKLERHTQGWVVGLKMAAISLQRQPDVAGFIASFTGSQRYIMDYLVEEVLERQSGELRNFLLKTSVLERLSAPLCDVLTGRADSHDRLQELERANLFIAPLNESREWYRYDHLFLDLLRHQLEIRFGAGHVAELHRRASQWYEEHGFPDEAIDHALEAKDWETAARLILSQLTEKERGGEWATMMRWLQQLPEEARNRYPRLLGSYGVMLIITGKLEDAAAITDRFEQAAKDKGWSRGYATELRSMIAHSRGDVGRAIELGEEALNLLPEDDPTTRSMMTLQLGSWHWGRGHLREAEPLLMAAYETGRKAGNRYVTTSSLAFLASEAHAKGELRRAFERFQQVVELAGPTPGAASSLQVLGAISYEWNDLDAASRQTQRAIELGRLTGQSMFVARQYYMLAQVSLARGDAAGAAEAFEHSCQLAHGTSQPQFRAEHASCHIGLALLQEDLATASEWGHKLADDAGALPFYYGHIPPRLLIAQGEKAMAAERLQVLYEEAVKGIGKPLVAVRLYQALAADTTESALRFLADVFAFTEPEGYIRTFVDEGRLLAPLLHLAISRKISAQYAAKLLAIIEAEKQRKLATIKRTNLLSERELEVLKLLAAGLSSRQIAEKLTVSLNTTNTHIRHIFEKLDSKSRVQAIARARELKLIR